MQEGKSLYKRALDHILNELKISNINDSIKRGRLDQLIKAHDSIHEFISLARICSSGKERGKWYSKSAFFIYHWEAFHLAHRALIEALEGYYNAGYTLLRSTLELLIKGAFWECLAHKKFRENSQIIKKCVVKFGKVRKTLLDWLNDIIEVEPAIGEEFEKISAVIYDKIYPIPNDSDLRKLIPSPKKIILQLSEWGILNPIPPNIVYQLYTSLSADVHVIPDRTDIGKRILQQKNLFEIAILNEELNKFQKQVF